MARASFPNFIGIRVEPETRAALEAQARKTGQSISDLVRARLREAAGVAGRARAA